MWHGLRNCTVSFTNGTLPSQRHVHFCTAADQRAPLLHLGLCPDGLLGSDLKSSSPSFFHSHVTGCIIRLTSPSSETNKPVCGMAKPSRCSGTTLSSRVQFLLEEKRRRTPLFPCSVCCSRRQQLPVFVIGGVCVFVYVCVLAS